jgi:hypothetical protein
MANIILIKEWIESMEKYVFNLERATKKGDKNEANRMRVFIFDLHKKIEEALKE